MGGAAPRAFLPDARAQFSRASPPTLECQDRGRPRPGGPKRTPGPSSYRFISRLGWVSPYTRCGGFDSACGLMVFRLDPRCCVHGVEYEYSSIGGFRLNEIHLVP